MARFFNGGTDAITVSDSASVQSPSTAITIGVWIRPSSSQDGFGGVANKIYGTSAPWLSYAIQQGGTARQYRFGISDGTGFPTNTSDTTTLTADAWYYLIARWEQGSALELRVYNADGTLNQTVTGSSSSITLGYSTSALMIGQTHLSSQSFWGRIANVFITDTKISDGEILGLMFGNPATIPSALYMPLFGGASPEIDISGNGNNGTLTGTSKADHAPVAQIFGFKPALVIVPAPSAQLQAAVPCAVTIAAALTTGITVAANAAATAVVSATLTTSIIFGSAINASASAATDLTTRINLDATVTSSAIAAATLTTATSFDAAVTVTAAQASSLTTQIGMVCAASGQATAAGLLTVGVNLDAAASVSASASGILATQIPLTATSAASAVSTAQLTTVVSLSANVSAAAASTGELSTNITLSADATAILSVAGTLNAQKIFNVVSRSADFKTVAAKSALFCVTRSNKVLFTRNRMKEVWF